MLLLLLLLLLFCMQHLLLSIHLHLFDTIFFCIVHPLVTCTYAIIAAKTIFFCISVKHFWYLLSQHFVLHLNKYDIIPFFCFFLIPTITLAYHMYDVCAGARTHRKWGGDNNRSFARERFFCFPLKLETCTHSSNGTYTQKKVISRQIRQNHLSVIGVIFFLCGQNHLLPSPLQQSPISLGLEHWSWRRYVCHFHFVFQFLELNSYCTVQLLNPNTIFNAISAGFFSHPSIRFLSLFGFCLQNLSAFFWLFF